MAEEVPNNLKQRFKGVENFLRRIAFNLGNTPSQTEVKIISCIPIDVTDLQQKICDLERVVTRLHKPPAIVHTALCEPSRPNSPGLQEDPEQTSLQERAPCENIIKDVKYLDEQKTITFNDITSLQPAPKVTVENKPKESIGGNHISSSLITFLNGNIEKNSTVKKSLFRKSRKKQEKKKHSKPKSHMVFYAQTENKSPFKIRKQVDKKTKFVEKKFEKNNTRKESKAPSPSYLSDVVRKQYEPLMHQLSAGSDFSSPICRDLKYSCSIAAYGSDICSCCHKDFLNIDNNEVSQEFGFSPTFQDQINSQNMYYDSSLYDLVPVKEAAVKAKKNFELPKTKKHYRTEIDYFNYMNYYADRPYDRQLYVNYNNTIVPTARTQTAQTIPRRAPDRKTHRRKPLNRRIDIYNEANSSIQDNTSNSCRVECGYVYKKPIYTKHEPPKNIEVKKNFVTYNDAETATFNNTECQTVTTIQNVNNSVPSEDKTEETLNQIKSILQSVLTEVKTNSKLNKSNAPPEEKLKKDAVVQKGASFGVIPGSSRLLNSFSYGTYNAGPYGASCSQPMNSGQHWYSPKCMHNFPVFIQTPGRLPYSDCYKKNSHVSKPLAKTARKATSAATNTSKEEQNNETNTLIKEIYKSLALNIDMPKRETSTSNYSIPWKQRPSRTSTRSSYRADRNERQSFDAAHSVCVRHNAPVSQYSSTWQSNKRRDARNSVLLTPFSSNTFSNKMTSNTVSVHSNALSSSLAGRLKSNRLGHYLDTTQETPSDDEREVRRAKKMVTHVNTAQDTPSDDEREDRKAKKSVRDTRKRVVLVNHEPLTTSTGITADTSSEESDTEQTQYQTENEVPKKKSLFSKMFKSVKLFKNRRKKSQKSKEESEDEESDSDDYQTVYSQQVQQPRRPQRIQIHVPPRKMPHSKVSYSRHMRGRNQEKARRAPLEQEYRRLWNEQLMYQPRPRYSTDQSSHHDSQRNMYNPYNQPYTRKAMMVEQGVPVRSTMFQDILTTMNPPRATPPRAPPPRAPPPRAPPPQRKGPGPPKGLSWFQRRMRCSQNIVRTLIEEN